MSPRRSQPYVVPNRSTARARAPLNSVSTRIILCVFVSTLLTALIVSWLSIGAVYKNVRSDVLHYTLMLLDERGAQIEVWHAAALQQLAASSAVDTAWHKALRAALGKHPGPALTGLYWVSSGLQRDVVAAAAVPHLDLPPPPPELAAFFERISLRSVAGPGSHDGDRSLGCLSARIDLVGANSDFLGALEGCLSSEGLFGFLGAPVPDFAGTRLLIIDREGRIGAAGGAHASSRLGEILPSTGATGRPLFEYTTADGTRKVSAMAQVGATGLYLVSEADHARAFAPAHAITRQIFIVDVCVILLFSVLAFKITLAIMKPIEALSVGARRIAQGQVDYQIPVPANNDDELGLLTRTFNDMMAKLRSNQLVIEQDRVRLGEKNDELQRANEILSQLSITDGLTKLHNHRYFQDSLTREIKRLSRTKTPLSLILIDIDDFKMLNDTHGHAAGDEVLISLAAIMNDSARESDLIARYGGEEFVILMPNTDLAGGVHLAEKIRMTVESTRLIIGDNMKPVEITISLGVALYAGNRRGFFGEADRALYQAKAAGKNCVIIASSDSTENA
jgi:diguanylate cyclase (GGDEF)-like protein